MGGCKKEGVASRDVHGRVQEGGSSYQGCTWEGARRRE